MVEYKEQEIWKCPYCDREYINEEDARECATECADVDSPINNSKTTYVCEYCKKEFKEEETAEECEKIHIENQDELYSRVALKKAAENPEQRRLLQ